MIGLRKLLGALVAVAPVAAGASDCLTYDKTGTSITGILSRVRVETRSIGEHPTPVTVTRWMLDTPKPFCVNGDEAQGNIAVSGASSIELLPAAESKLVPLIGKRVRIVGRLLPTYTPHYHAYLIMQVGLVSEAGEREP